VVSNKDLLEVGMTFGTHMGMYLLINKIGRITGVDGGYIVSGERYIPDIAFISFARQPEASHEAYNPNPSDLAVVVLSPTDDPAYLRIKM
jgi:Uma2 family endonuclease